MTTWPVTWWHNVVDGETDARDASGMMVVTMRRGRWTQVLIGAMIMVTMMRWCTWLVPHVHCHWSSPCSLGSTTMFFNNLVSFQVCHINRIALLCSRWAFSVSHSWLTSPCSCSLLVVFNLQHPGLHLTHSIVAHPTLLDLFSAHPTVTACIATSPDFVLSWKALWAVAHSYL